MERVSVLKEAGVAPETHKGGTITVTPGIMLVLSAVKSTETHAHTHTQAHTCVNRTEHPVVYNISSDSFDESFIRKYLLSASYTHTHHTHGATDWWSLWLEQIKKGVQSRRCVWKWTD